MHMRSPEGLLFSVNVLVFLASAGGAKIVRPALA